jgi:hypothetical protein
MRRQLSTRHVVLGFPDIAHSDAWLFCRIWSHKFNQFVYDCKASASTLKKNLSVFLQPSHVRGHKQGVFPVLKSDPSWQVWKSRKNHLFLRWSMLTQTIHQPYQAFNGQRTFNLIHERWLGIVNTFSDFLYRNAVLAQHQGGFRHYFQFMFKAGGKHGNTTFRWEPPRHASGWYTQITVFAISACHLNWLKVGSGYYA